MAYTGEQRDSNLQEPEFMSNVKIVDSGIIEGFGKWTLDEDGLLTIEGTGKMPDWDCDQCDYVRGVAWHRVREKIKSVRIADTVISIGDRAFYFCKNLESIIIPNSVTRIGDLAFGVCESLKSIIIPNSVTRIGKYAFCYCKSLKSIIIPNSVTDIENYAFSHCGSLKYVKMPEKLNCLFFKSMYGISKKYVEFY